MTDITDQRQARLIGRVAQKEGEQYQSRVAALRARPDFQPELDYFLKLMENPAPAEVAERTGRPLMALLCLQAPLELFHALGLQPFKIFSGSYVTGQLAANNLPAIMCPMLRSVLGALRLDCDLKKFFGWVLPTTCDWVVKFPEMLKMIVGADLSDQIHWLELPHLKEDEDSRGRWLEEIYKLKDYLTALTGRKLKLAALEDSLAVYQQAWKALSQLTEARRLGRVPAVWFTLITNSFFYDTVERWTEALDRALPLFEKDPENQAVRGRVFLAGSPVFFPNFKIFDLLEEAGLTVTADDLCSSERIFPGAVNCGDRSEFGFLSALAERYHQGCLCPTFADNDRRINNIIGPQRKACYEGVVFQVLKGCHPYDLESFTLAETLKDNGLRYLRLETDHSAEDSQNLLTRLEAYRHNLESTA